MFVLLLLLLSPKDTFTLTTEKIHLEIPAQWQEMKRPNRYLHYIYTPHQEGEGGERGGGCSDMGNLRAPFPERIKIVILAVRILKTHIRK